MIVISQVVLSISVSSSVSNVPHKSWIQTMLRFEYFNHWQLGDYADEWLKFFHQLFKLCFTTFSNGRNALSCVRFDFEFITLS